MLSRAILAAFLLQSTAAAGVITGGMMTSTIKTTNGVPSKEERVLPTEGHFSNKHFGPNRAAVNDFAMNQGDGANETQHWVSISANLFGTPEVTQQLIRGVFDLQIGDDGAVLHLSVQEEKPNLAFALDGQGVDMRPDLFFPFGYVGALEPGSHRVSFRNINSGAAIRYGAGSILIAQNVPEPSGLAMMGLAGAGLFFVRAPRRG